MNVEQKTIQHQRRVVFDQLIYLYKRIHRGPAFESCDDPWFYRRHQDVFVLSQKLFICLGTIDAGPFFHYQRN